MMYEYKCPSCGTRDLSSKCGDRLERWCDFCESKESWKRCYTVSLPRPVMDHFNHSLGRGVTGITDFREQLKVKAGEAEERTGMPVQYAEISHEEARHGVTEEGMDATNRERVARGQKAIP